MPPLVPTEARTPLSSRRPVLAVWLLLAGLTTAPYLHAWLHPVSGYRFLGFFFQIEDIYNYLSYVQQAEDGAFAFVNKLGDPKLPASLVNLEWLAVGRLAALSGHRPAATYRVVGILATLALLAGVARLLRRVGIAPDHTTTALLLVALGGGVGGLRYLLFGPPAWRSLDLISGMYPFVAALINPHMVIGSGLTIWALLAFLDGSTGRALLLGCVLGLVRPYDLVMLIGIRVAGVCSSEAPRFWVRRLLPLAAFAPVLAYSLWAFYVSPAFRNFSNVHYDAPPLADMLVALGPAAALAAFGVREPGGEAAARAHQNAWSGLGLAIAIFRPVSIALQFLAGLGVPLLVLGARALARQPPRVTLLAALAFASTPCVALGIVLFPNPRWFVPQERFDAALALRATCRPGERLMAPPDIGLYAGALTACSPWVAYAATSDYASRMSVLERFYTRAAPQERRRMLRELGVRHLVLPGDAGPEAAGWLGEASGYRRVALLSGPEGVLSVYSEGHEP
jgi:hypothetical protein